VKTTYKRSFLNDIRRVNDPGIKRRLEEVINRWNVRNVSAN